MGESEKTDMMKKLRLKCKTYERVIIMQDAEIETLFEMLLAEKRKGTDQPEVTDVRSELAHRINMKSGNKLQPLVNDKFSLGANHDRILMDAVERIVITLDDTIELDEETSGEEDVIEEKIEEVKRPSNSVGGVHKKPRKNNQIISSKSPLSVKSNLSGSRPHTRQSSRSPAALPASEPVSRLQRWRPLLEHGHMYIESQKLDPVTGSHSPWQTRRVVRRLGHRMVVTRSGRLYVLEGSLRLGEAPVPAFIRDSFAAGLPEDWWRLVARWRCWEEVRETQMVRSYTSF